jgi:hypothetical protein
MPVKTILAALVALTFGIGAAFAADEVAAPKGDKPAASKKKAKKAKRPARKQQMKKEAP